MQLQKIDSDLSVCQVSDVRDLDMNLGFYFVGRTDEEISLVCETAKVPGNARTRDDGWKAFRIKGTLDFSLIGILSEISGILAANRIGIFAVSTFNTDYILVKRKNFEKALKALSDHGYDIL